MEATNWLDDAVQRTKEKYQIQRALEEKVVQEETLKKRLGSQYCRELFAWLESVEVNFNSRFGCQVLAVNVIGNDGERSVQVLARPIRSQERIAEVKYQHDTCLGLTTGSDGTAEPVQALKLVLTNGAMLAEMGAERFTPEQLGRRIIDDLLA